jgi:hypothetical protein
MIQKRVSGREIGVAAHPDPCQPSEHVMHPNRPPLQSLLTIMRDVTRGQTGGLFFLMMNVADDDFAMVMTN